MQILNLQIWNQSAICSCFVICILSIICQFANGENCSDLPPFLLDTLGRGVDLASLDLQPRLDDLQSGYSLFKEQIVRLTCDRGEQLRIEEHEYQLPDQVLRLYEQYSQDYTRHDINVKDELDYRRKMAASFGIPLTEGKVCKS